MTKTLTLLLAATALSTAIAIPAWSAMRAAMPERAPQLILVDDDEGDDEDYAVKAGKGDHDDGEEDGDDDDGCEDDDGACGAGTNPAPAGNKPPPANGLFGKGEPPKAQVN